MKHRHLSQCDLHPQTVARKFFRENGIFVRYFFREIGIFGGWNVKFQFGARCMARPFHRVSSVKRLLATPHSGGHLALAESDEEHDVQV